MRGAPTASTPLVPSVDSKPPAKPWCTPHPQLWPFVLTVIWFFSCVYFNCVLQVIVQKREDFLRDLPAEYRVLPDIGFDLLPKLQGPTATMNWADMWVTGSMLVTICRFIVRPHFRSTVFRRWLFCLGTLFLLRGFCIISTMLPNPYLHCKANANGNVWLEGLLIFTQQHATCADVLYSGHTVNLTLVGLVWHTYSHLTPLTTWDPAGPTLCCGVDVISPIDGSLQRCTSAKMVTWGFIGVGYILIVATHFHYTVDVLIGLIMSVLLWNWYHSAIRTAHLKQALYSGLLTWMEADAADLRQPLIPQPGIELL